MKDNFKIKFGEKLGYALGDGAANIAWRGVATFLFIFYTDVFGISPAVVGILFLVARFGDGISDVLMGIIGDRTTSKYGKFRPWIFWSAIPLGLSLSLLFTAPELSMTGKIIYAYATYILFTLVYTANNIPYGALMAVMTPDNRVRTVLGSYRMVGAFAGGMIVQGALLFLVAYFGNINPDITVRQLDKEKFEVTVSSPMDVENVRIKTKDGIAAFSTKETTENSSNEEPVNALSFSMKANTEYAFIAEGETSLTASTITIIDQKKGYSHSMYVMSILLSMLMFITFASTKERVLPPKTQESNLKNDFKDLIRNKPWLVLLFVGLLFNVYNSIKQGIVVIYFTHYISDQLLAGTYLVALMVASIAGALATAYLGRFFGKKQLFLAALILSSSINALFVFCGPQDIFSIFLIGSLSEFASAIFPTLFFAMLGDVADFSEFKNGRRATGLIYSAGSFATKFGGGIAGAIVGLVLGAYHYNGQVGQSVQGAFPGIIMLMSWIPSLIGLLTAAILAFYPLSQKKMDAISIELQNRRSSESID